MKRIIKVKPRRWWSLKDRKCAKVMERLIIWQIDEALTYLESFVKED